MSIFKRSISLLLVLCFCLSLMPTAFASELSSDSSRPDADALTDQIERVYKAIRSERGRGFKGACGTFVRMQIKELGIIPDGCYTGHGKQQYDLYQDIGETENGYTVTAYPASDYDIAEALNAITANGTRNAYNILVGFEKGTGSNGKAYGHVIFIHGIIDGTVYFSECFKYNGASEGTPHAWSISKFADVYQYRRNTKEYLLDGLIHFQSADLDTPSSVDLSINHADFSIGEDVVFSLSSDVSCAYELSIWNADSGERIFSESVESTYQTNTLAAGHYRAQFRACNPAAAADSNTVEFYVFGSVPSTASLCIDQTELEPGQTVCFSATSDADYAKLRMNLFLSNDTHMDTQLPVDTVSDSQCYTPEEPGIYTGYVTAYTHEGETDSNWVTFHVGSFKIAYDANGGNGAPAGQIKYYGQDILLADAAPERQRYTFLGWAISPDADFADYQPGELFSVNGDTTLYAVWESNCANGDHFHQAVITEPSCLEPGCTTYICECGDTFEDAHTDPLGHDYAGELCIRCGQSVSDLWEYRENPFDDLTANSFCYAPVLWAVENSITSGTSGTTFSPNSSCLRSHVVTFLWRAAGSPEPDTTENPFVDVKETDFYYNAVLWAVENGITNGADATHFNPMGVCNRAQVVTFLYRAFGSPSVENSGNPFTDVPSGGWYTAPMLWAVENGITNGLSADSFGPNTDCNRAQIVTFLYRAYN